MPLGNVWSFPSREMPYSGTLFAMKSLAERIAKITSGHKEFGHPIDINVSAGTGISESGGGNLETAGDRRADPETLHVGHRERVRRRDPRRLRQDSQSELLSDIRPRPVAARSVDYLNADFQGEYLDRYILPKPKPRIAMFHSVGGADAVLLSELKERINDGLPERLPSGKFNGLTHIKIKLQGEDLKWDVERTVNIDRVASETSPKVAWKYCVDFNERCPNVEYVLEYLRKVKELMLAGFDRILY